LNRLPSRVDRDLSRSGGRDSSPAQKTGEWSRPLRERGTSHWATWERPPNGEGFVAPTTLSSGKTRRRKRNVQLSSGGPEDSFRGAGNARPSKNGSRHHGGWRGYGRTFPIQDLKERKSGCEKQHRSMRESWTRPRKSRRVLVSTQG